MPAVPVVAASTWAPVRGEPDRPPSLLHRLGSAAMLGLVSVLLGLATAAAVGIAAFALFVIVRGAVG